MYRLTNLMATYCERMDAGDFEAVGELFARGRLCDEHGTTLAEGASDVSGFYRSTVVLHNGSPRTKHLVLNSVVDIEDEGASLSARLRSSYLVLQGLDGELTPMICGRYHDRFARDDTDPRGWYFQERRFFVDLMGDLSRHLGLTLR